MPRYVPEKGDFVILTFDPQTGREQRGRRPALVVSNMLFNRRTGLAMVCPVTNTFRSIPFGAYIDSLTPFAAAPCCRITPSANPTYEGLSVSGRSD